VIPDLQNQMFIMNTIMKSQIYFLTLLFTLCLTSCGSSDDSDSQGNSDDPSDLSVSFTVAEDGSGEVTVDASANNAILYEFNMGTSDNAKGSSETGIFTYTYETTGQYFIEVKAYGNSGRFVRTETEISVLAGDPGTIGEGYTTPITYDGMEIFWNDEFDGTVLDQSAWDYDIGDGCPNLCGWGNNELEYYRAQNSTVRNGILTLEARAENFQNSEYTSAKLKTQGKKAFTYGRVDVRAKLPTGQGLWPAIWMLGQNIESVGWPETGEIDIMEMVGGNGGEKKTFGTVHWKDANGNHASTGGNRSVTTGLDEKFYVYSIIWDESRIQWLLDDVPYHSVNITGDDMGAFHKPFYMILNVAVGGNWPGNPNATTEFPTSMEVDYVRVFQEK